MELVSTYRQDKEQTLRSLEGPREKREYSVLGTILVLVNRTYYCDARRRMILPCHDVQGLGRADPEPGLLSEVGELPHRSLRHTHTHTKR